MKFSTDLPSRMLPYANLNVKGLEMANFSIPQIKKLSKAVALDSIVPVIEALGEVLNVDVDQLTDGDYNYLLCYQRVANYSSAPLASIWTCNNLMLREQQGLKRLFSKEKIMELVEAYDSATPAQQADMQNPAKLMVESEDCGHKNNEAIEFKDLQVVHLTDAPLDHRLDYPRVLTLSDAIVAKRDIEKRNLVDAVRWIKEGDSLAEKFEILESDPDAINLLQAALAANLTHAHGVKRHVSKKCAKCSAPQETIFEIDASMFFRV